MSTTKKNKSRNRSSSARLNCENREHIRNTIGNILTENIVFNEPVPETDDKIKQYFNEIASNNRNSLSLAELDYTVNRNNSEIQDNLLMQTPLSSAKRKHLLNNNRMVRNVKRKLTFTDSNVDD